VVVKRVAFLTGFLVIHQFLFAQGELEEPDKIFYKNERTFAILLNSNGLGINYRYGKRVTALRKIIYEGDLVNIKHPKEIKLNSGQYYISTRSFVYGKINQFYNLRIGIGLQDEMFPKFDRGGISIRRYYAFGPTIGIKKPIYYQINVDMNNDAIPETQIIEKFSYDQHLQTAYIVGRASFFKGINEVSFVPGLYGKFGFMFEFGKFNETIHALDAGIIIDAFLKEIPIMAAYNSQVFLTLFVSYRFGKVINARFKMKKTELDELITD
jgi:hypothetical protein